MNHKFVVFTKDDCVHCYRVKELLTLYNIPYIAFDITHDELLKRFLVESGLTTVPQVFNRGQLIGGYEATRSYLELIHGIGT